MKRIIILSMMSFVLYSLNGQGQCNLVNDHIWESHWQSCQPTTNPNGTRGVSHWVLYDLGAVYRLSNSWIWNINKNEALGMGFKNVVVDYSVNGSSWTELGSYQFSQGSGAAFYKGFAGPDFANKAVRYVLITALDNWGDASCYGISEVRFNMTEPNEVPETNTAVPPTLFALEVSLGGDGTGVITRDVERVTYPSGSNVQLTATPTDNSTFLGWSGSITSSENPLSITMDEHYFIIANFSSEGSLNCQAAQLTPGGMLGDGQYIASTSIVSDGTVPTDGSVTFSAGQQIDLLSEFTVTSGGVFVANIANCNN